MIQTTTSRLTWKIVFFMGFVASGLLWNGFLQSNTAFADTSNKQIIDNNTATKLISKHIGNDYMTEVPVGEYSQTYGSNESREKAIQVMNARLSALKQGGYLTYTTTKFPRKSDMLGREFFPMKWDIRLTEKGKNESVSVPNSGFGDAKSVVGFLTQNQTVEKIVAIDADNTVLFVSRFELTPLGKAEYSKMPDWVKSTYSISGKERGKAQFKYDPFLEKHNFTGWWWSEWEKEEWNKGRWTYEKNGKKIRVN